MPQPQPTRPFLQSSAAPPADRGRPPGIGRRCRHRRMPCGLLVILLGCVGGRAMGATLTSSDFTLAISHTDLSGNTSTLNENQLKTFFTAARCSCTTNVSLTLALTSAGATNLGSSSIDAQVSIGSDCDNLLHR